MTKDLTKLRRCDSLDFIVGRLLLNIKIDGRIAPEIEIKLNGPEYFEMKLARAMFGWVNPDDLDKLKGRRIAEAKAWVNLPCRTYPGLISHWLSIRTDNGKLLTMTGRTFDPITTPIVAKREPFKVRNAGPAPVVREGVPA